jgi:hypothetical protein
MAVCSSQVTGVERTAERMCGGDVQSHPHANESATCPLGNGCHLVIPDLEALHIGLKLVRKVPFQCSVAEDLSVVRRHSRLFACNQRTHIVSPSNLADCWQH